MGRYTKYRADYLGRVAVIVTIGCGLPIIADAANSQFTAEKVMKEMKSDERVSYLAGVIEGLAVARYMKDGKKKDGMECIYDWFYEDKKNLEVIYDAFDKYASYPPGAILDVLTKQKCGE